MPVECQNPAGFGVVEKQRAADHKKERDRRPVKWVHRHTEVPGRELVKSGVDNDVGDAVQNNDQQNGQAPKEIEVYDARSHRAAPL